jgi:hypothetical protein
VVGGREARVNRAWSIGRDNQASFMALLGAAPELERWAATALFYSALHFTEAALRRWNEPPAKAHEVRWRQIRAHFDDAYLEHYMALKDASEGWRYWGRSISNADLQRCRSGHYEHVLAEARRQAQPTI